MRLNKIPKRGLQLRMTLVFVTIACFAALFQVFLINRALIELAQTLPNDGQVVADRLPALFQASVSWTVVVLIPCMLVVGVLVTFRVAGPAYRLERYLDEVAEGGATEPCTIRKRDELQELCTAVNRAVATLRGEAAAPAGRAVEPEPATAEAP